MVHCQHALQITEVDYVRAFFPYSQAVKKIPTPVTEASAIHVAKSFESVLPFAN